MKLKSVLCALDFQKPSKVWELIIPEYECSTVASCFYSSGTPLERAAAIGTGGGGMEGANAIGIDDAIAIDGGLGGAAIAIDGGIGGGMEGAAAIDIDGA